MMASVTLSSDEVIEAFCKMLAPGVKKGVLPPEDCNKYGIDVLTRRSDAAQIMFHFITLEDFEINLVLDLIELQARGKEYLTHLYGLLCDQVVQARGQRQEEGKIVIYEGPKTRKAEFPALKPSVVAHNEAIH